VAASIMAGAGVAGIPEVGLIVLPLVLKAAGLSDATIVSALPLVMAVDWIIARVRSGVNVMSDMLIAILLDIGSHEPEAEEDSPLTPGLVTPPSHRPSESIKTNEELG
jgi:Na+/H+-dicarboxylate symporter